MSDTAADVQALTLALPELPKPAWFAVDTEGSEYDVTFVDDRNQAHGLAIDQDDIEDKESLITALYSADQMVSYATLHAAALLEENERLRKARIEAEALVMSHEGRIEGLERDAARYRWLRDVGDATWRPFGLREGCSAELADAAIDAAQSTKKDGA